jgi:hypothetical protein
MLLLRISMTTLVCGQLACSMHDRTPVLWSGGGAGEAAAQLQESPVELADLYNDYAAHFQVRSLLPPPPCSAAGSCVA